MAASKANYTFSPSGITATSLSGNHTGINFTATTPLSGPGIITTVAGNGIGGFGGDGGLATNAGFDFPKSVAVDSVGNIYIADANNSRIRKVDHATGVITTVAGNGTFGFNGDGGLATNAVLNHPYGVALDSAGNIYIADHYNSRIRRVDHTTGIITTVAGNGTAGYSGDGSATNASLNYPYGVALDSAGNIYIADFDNSRIRKVDHTTGIITTVAGSGAVDFSGDGGLATSAGLYWPRGVALDSIGNLYILDYGNSRIRKVDQATGIIATVAGNGTFGFSGDGGLAMSATLNPSGVALDSAGNIYIADADNSRIRKVDHATGVITTVAGNGTFGFNGDGGLATNAVLNDPYGVALDSTGNVYIADTLNNRIRMITSSLQTYTVTGTITSGGSPLVGVVVAVSGSASTTAVTAADGTYSFSLTSGGNYTLTPSSANYTFSPMNVSTTNLSGNWSGNNFTATFAAYTVSGTLMYSGAPLEGAVVSLSGNTSGSVTTGSGGTYSFAVVGGGNYVIKPSKSGYFFTPAQLAANAVSASLTGQDFTSGYSASASVAVVGGPKGYVEASKGGQAVIHLNAPTQSGQVSVKIYTLRNARLVRDYSIAVAAGTATSLVWNCLNTDGEMIGSGVYLAVIKGAGYDEKIKIGVLR